MGSSVRLALRIALVIMVCGVFWVAISNDFLSDLAPNRSTLIRYHVYTEWVYVLAVSVLVYFLTKRVFDLQAATEKELRKSEEQFKRFIEHAPIALAMLDRDMRYLAVSDRWKTVFNEGEKTFVGRSHYEVFPDIPEQWKEQHRRGLNEEVLQIEEDRLTRKDGSAFWIRRGIRPWYANDGSIGGLILFAEDITQRKQAETALSASELKFRLLFENSRDGLLTNAPPSWKFSSVNRAALQMFGIKNNAGLTALAPWDISPEYQPDGMSSAEKAEQLIATALREGSSFFEWTYKRLDGTTFPAEVLLTRMELNSSVFIQGSLRDISERKKLEKDVLERRHEMEKLQKSQVAAQTVSAIAHELNQPLAAISSYSQAALLMLDSGDPNLPKLRAAIEASGEQALRAGQSLREMLLTLNIGEFPVEAFDLNQEIHGILAMARAEHELNFHSRLYLDEQLPSVRANRAHIQKALFNLLHNSIDAMQQAGVVDPALAVTIRTQQDKNVAQVTVRDNGPGIEKEMIHRLFQPFFTSKPHGIGMGLVISRSLVEANGGQLWVDPHEKPGATFHMTIPLVP